MFAVVLSVSVYSSVVLVFTLVWLKALGLLNLLSETPATPRLQSAARGNARTHTHIHILTHSDIHTHTHAHEHAQTHTILEPSLR